MGKIINKVIATKILKDGGYLSWDRFCAKGTIYDKNENFVGNLQLKTYYNLCEKTKTENINTQKGWEERKYLHIKTEKEKFQNKKVYMLFDKDGNKFNIGKTKTYFTLGHIKNALRLDLQKKILYQEALSKESSIEEVKKEHFEFYKDMKIVEYELKQKKEINCSDLLE